MTKLKSIQTLIFLLIFQTQLALIACSPTDSNDDKEMTEKTDPFEQNTIIGRAVNLGNALEAPNEGDWGVTLKEEYYQVISQASFEAVRIPIRWSTHTMVDSPYVIEEDFFRRIDWAIGRSRANDLAVIINVHHYEEIFSHPNEQKERFLEMWRQISNRYKDYPSDVFFEILNEPHDQLTAELWNEFMEEVITLIRVSNPNRTLIIGTAEWGGMAALQKLIIPENETNLILTIHYYNPFHFTHQGAQWVDGSDDWLGEEWLGTLDEKFAVQNEFSQIKEWADNHNMPVFLGEFGAYSRASMESRVRWTSFISREAERQGFSWAYWEFCSGFGIYDQQTGQWNENLLEALLPVE